MDCQWSAVSICITCILSLSSGRHLETNDSVKRFMSRRWNPRSIDRLTTWLPLGKCLSFTTVRIRHTSLRVFLSICRLYYIKSINIIILVDIIILIDIKYTYKSVPYKHTNAIFIKFVELKLNFSEYFVYNM